MCWPCPVNMPVFVIIFCSFLLSGISTERLLQLVDLAVEMNRAWCGGKIKRSIGGNVGGFKYSRRREEIICNVDK